VQLLGEIEARAALFKHGDHRAQVAFGSLEPFQDLWVALVLLHF